MDRPCQSIHLFDLSINHPPQSTYPKELHEDVWPFRLDKGGHSRGVITGAIIDTLESHEGHATGYRWGVFGLGIAQE